MTLSEFWLSVLASIIASICIAGAAKVTLRVWKQVLLGVGATVLIAAVMSVVIFSAINVTRAVSAYLERSALQDKITTYTKGHYPEALKSGYSVEVLEIRNRAFLGFIYPEGSGYPAPHPLSNPSFEYGITKLLNDNGVPGSPIWGYPMRWGETAEDVVKRLEQK